MITEERLQEIEERAREATKGPWKECAAQDGCGLVWSVPVDAPIATTNTDCDAEGIASSKERKLADAAFIAAAREDVPALVAEVRRLRKLASLVTVRQVIEAGDEYIEAAGLNPWCMNEGLATGNERIGL